MSTSNIYPDFPEAKAIEPAFNDNDIYVADYDMPTNINHLDVGLVRVFFLDNFPNQILVITVVINDPKAIYGQFDSHADALVINFLVYLHTYRPCT